ncbi:hypothetical protein QP794_24175 [Paenibacillus sp. UMB7766-LJ446]|uniref:hypothetical protein n=1 Tax=Paenibacillus sp. UMB7766-LJ446 TaxID=3046313 RepID=UPI00254DFBBD|nr:hypothetical protein [Paenibacillus sp. UMB7766-LJ446]MDK8193189.1 hypothetical protein [Paenibacillus sp. UMB7766-LJ446]
MKNRTSSVEGLLSFQELKADPGKPGVESVLREVSKLRTIRNLELPDDLFRDIPLKVLTKYRQRTATEDLRELRRHLIRSVTHCWPPSSGL